MRGRVPCWRAACRSLVQSVLELLCDEQRPTCTPACLLDASHLLLYIRQCNVHRRPGDCSCNARELSVCTAAARHASVLLSQSVACSAPRACAMDRSALHSSSRACSAYCWRTIDACFAYCDSSSMSGSTTTCPAVRAISAACTACLTKLAFIVVREHVRLIPAAKILPTFCTARRLHVR